MQICKSTTSLDIRIKTVQEARGEEEPITTVRWWGLPKLHNSHAGGPCPRPLQAFNGRESCECLPVSENRPQFATETGLQYHVQVFVVFERLV